MLCEQGNLREFPCPRTKVSKKGKKGEHLCASDVCDTTDGSEDEITCCDNRQTCNYYNYCPKLTHILGKLKNKTTGDDRMCAEAICANNAEDWKNCCDERGRCDKSVCDLDTQLFKPEKVRPKDDPRCPAHWCESADCCVPRATCSTMSCPTATHVPTQNDKSKPVLYCTDEKCSINDQDDMRKCCEPRGECLADPSKGRPAYSCTDKSKMKKGSLCE